MSEFEKEYQSLRLEIGDYDRLLGHGDVVDKFKDWQPPKPLVVVPQRFADWIESQTDRKEESYWYIFDKFVKDSRSKKLGIDFFGVGDLSRYPQGWDKVLLSALVDGYTIEKEKKYYLREKNTGYYLTKKGDTLKLVVNPYFDETNEFAQEEIDKLNIGSYEQIEEDE